MSYDHDGTKKVERNTDNLNEIIVGYRCKRTQRLLLMDDIRFPKLVNRSNPTGINDGVEQDKEERAVIAEDGNVWMV
jgi:hypothetical protein